MPFPYWPKEGRHLRCARPNNNQEGSFDEEEQNERGAHHSDSSVSSLLIKHELLDRRRNFGRVCINGEMSTCNGQHVKRRTYICHFLDIMVRHDLIILPGYTEDGAGASPQKWPRVYRQERPDP